MMEDEKAFLGGGQVAASDLRRSAGWREHNQAGGACPARHRCRARLSGWLDDRARGLLFGGIDVLDGYSPR
jgi:hypothetical protein